MGQSACSIFIENYVDANGCSPEVSIIELVEKFGDKFRSNNGCQWARKGSSLDKRFILKRIHANERGGKGNTVVAIQTLGFRTDIENHSIPITIRTALKNTPCSVLGVITSDMEIDHKNGRYDSENYSLEDFQRLTKGVNDAKREHCKRCRETGCRFMASLLGYSVDYTEGDSKSDNCEGCYWHDPKQFNSKVSQYYVKREEK